MIVHYKGFYIDVYETYKELITVQDWCGDDLIFSTVEEAKAWIDKEVEA